MRAVFNWISVCALVAALLLAGGVAFRGEDASAAGGSNMGGVNARGGSNVGGPTAGGASAAGGPAMGAAAGGPAEWGGAGGQTYGPQSTFADGSAAAPNISWQSSASGSNAPNSGLYYGGTGATNVSVNGTNTFDVVGGGFLSNGFGRFAEQSAPAVSTSGFGETYADSATHQLMQSENGTSWGPVGRLTAVVTLTSAQVLALNTTPITLVAAPGTGNAVIFDGATAKLVFNSTAYTDSSGVLTIAYTNSSGVAVGPTIPASFVTTSSGTAYAYVPPVATELAPAVNAPLVIYCTSANPTAGNSTIQVTIQYHVLTP